MSYVEVFVDRAQARRVLPLIGKARKAAFREWIKARHGKESAKAKGDYDALLHVECFIEVALDRKGGRR